MPVHAWLAGKDKDFRLVVCAAVMSLRPIVALADPPSAGSAPSDALVSTCSEAEAGLSPVHEKADDVKSTEPAARPSTVATVE